uniref:Variant surface glycoprotein 1125.5450 n=1 Tax=Trypanosoma brucei TaxID=5691 RepID=A0A1J0RCH8_9TRYP|nr:variant surface glycoprotein 1125.5450 [Trypanosoma brucei]
MVKALYGPAAKPEQSVSDMVTDTPYTAVLAPTTFQREGTDRDNTCEKAATSSAKKAGHVLAKDMIRPCSVQANGGGNNFCGEGKGGDNNAIHTSDQVQKATEVWTTIVKQYNALNRGKPPLLTQAALTAEVTAIFTHLGRNYIALTGAPAHTTLVDKRRDFLGFDTIYNNGPSCKAPVNTATTAGKGVCIDYSAQMRDAKGIPWVALVRQAASDLEAMQADFEASKDIVGATEAIKTTMDGLLQIAPFVGTNSGSVAANTGKIPEPTTALQHKCKAENTTADECPSDHCVYDGNAEDGNKCKPKL